MDLLKDRLITCMAEALHRRDAEAFSELLSLTIQLIMVEGGRGQPVCVEWNEGSPTICEPVACEDNDSKRAGQAASKNLFFEPGSRFCVQAKHTRFDDVEWFVFDAELRDTFECNPPSVIAQCATLLAAVDAVQEFQKEAIRCKQ